MKKSQIYKIIRQQLLQLKKPTVLDEKLIEDIVRVSITRILRNKDIRKQLIDTVINVYNQTSQTNIQRNQQILKTIQKSIGNILGKK